MTTNLYVLKGYPAVIDGLWLKCEAKRAVHDQAVGALGHGAKGHEPEHGLDQILSNLPNKLKISLEIFPESFRKIKALSW